MEIPLSSTNRVSQFFNSRRGRNLREYFTAYLMLAPALTLIFIFGLFPVGFALYVSVHKWRILRSDFRGLQNYTASVSSFAYIGLFVLGIGAISGVYFLLRKIIREARENKQAPWLLALPAALHAWATLAFFRWIFFQLPEFLDIATNRVQK